MSCLLACGSAGRDEGGSRPAAASALGGASAGGAAGGQPNGMGGVGGAAGSRAQAGRANTSGGAPALGSVDCAHDGDGTTTLVFRNGCDHSVIFAGSDIDGGSLAPGDARCVDIGSAIEALSAKRYWGYGATDPGAGHYSLAEFTFNTDFHDFDWYDISFVDAFNLPLGITPLARPDCQALTCADDFLAGCPDVGQLRQNGEVVACVSPERDNGASPVAQYFEGCDDAYAWSADDQHGSDPSPTHACAGEDFELTFCPEPKP